jgi:hypothetical protein
MISDRKLRANQQNAKRSTGPRSVAGKQKASRNAARHGLSRLTEQPWFTDEVRKLALGVCGDADPARLEQALIWAEAELTIRQAHKAQVAVIDNKGETPNRYPRQSRN